MDGFQRLVIRGVLGFMLGATLIALDVSTPVYVVAAVVGTVLIWALTGDLPLLRETHSFDSERRRKESELD